jgi:hypothetical protein
MNHATLAAEYIKDRERASLGLLSFATHPCVVANGRLRSAGWVPIRTNEQAYVAGTEAKWWTMLTPKRKQELSLAAMGLSSLGLLTTAVLLIAHVLS